MQHGSNLGPLRCILFLHQNERRYFFSCLPLFIAYSLCVRRYVVYQQMQRWLRAGCFERLAEDVRSLLREWGESRCDSPRSVPEMHSSAPLNPQSNISGYSGNRLERSWIPSHRKTMKSL